MNLGTHGIRSKSHSRLREHSDSHDSIEISSTLAGVAWGELNFIAPRRVCL